jgi:SAM-dependent methyltransferase
VTYSPDQLRAIRRSRRHARPTQFDYLHLRLLVRDLEAALAGLGPVGDALDVWSGARPYDDLLPAGTRLVALDVEDNPYGVADVVSNDFLPFPDASFDLVLCIEAFQWVPDPVAAVAEFRRVLRPSGAAVVSVPFAFEYERTFETRYTEWELRRLFEGWDDVAVSENGGRAVAWTVLTASLLEPLRQRAWPLRPLLAGAVAGLNGIGLALARLESRLASSDAAFPMNLLLTAHRPADG